MSLVVNSGDRSTSVVSHGGSRGEPGSRDGCGSRGGQDYRGGGRESLKIIGEVANALMVAVTITRWIIVRIYMVNHLGQPIKSHLRRISLNHLDLLLALVPHPILIWLQS
jgi:hypothetical protein